MDDIKSVTEKEVKIKKEKEHSLTLFNDDFNTFDHVAKMLVKVCKHDELQAEQCATIVHYNGKCTIKNGEYESLVYMSKMLLEAGLTVEVD